MNIEFMRFRKMASALSIILLIISIGSLAIKNLELGLDFTGGILLEIKLDQDIENLEVVRNLLAEEGIENFVLNFSGSQDDLSIKIPGGEDSSNNESLKKILKDNFPYDLRKEEFIGPQVGEELRDQGGLGLLIALLIMTVYIMFRFQYKFAVGAILALAHDVLIVLGFFSLLSIDFDLTVLAALLAVIGYSLNDTIVVSDRIRENFRKKRRAEATQLIDKSLNQMLGRTLITSLTTLLVLFALFIFIGSILAFFLTTPKNVVGGKIDDDQTAKEALKEAFNNKSFIYLTLGFFVCGWHIALVATHIPVYINDRGLPEWCIVTILSMIGLFNIVGTLTSGYFAQKYSKKLILSAIYLARGLVIIIFIFLPPSPIIAVFFGIAFGFLWLSTVPPTMGLVGFIFGTKSIP